MAVDTTSVPSSILDDAALREKGADVLSFDHSETIGETALSPAAARTARRVVWKLDLFILPLVSLVYFFVSMCRSDIANALIAGMEEELHLDAQDYTNAANIFLIGYIVFQLPATVFIKKVGPPLQFGVAMIAWGALTACTTSIHSKGALLALRFLIGSCESAVQGAVFYLSFWYKYREIATRGAIFYATSALAGAFNGLISYGIAKDLNHVNGWLAWRWIFLVEGIMPIFFGFVVIFLLPATPEKLKFGFSAAEKEIAIRRSREAHNTEEAKFLPKLILTALLRPVFWILLAMNCAGHFLFSTVTNFLPAIILSFGYTTVKSQLMSVIVYACAFLGIIFFARIADITNKKGLTLVAAQVWTCVGYALLIGLENHKARFAACCILAFGVFANVVLILVWVMSCTPGYTQRGASVAFMNMFATAFAISGNQVYTDPPYYRKSQIASLCLSAALLVLALLNIWYLSYLNRRKVAEQYSPEADELRRVGVDQVGDRHPDFFYHM